MVKGVIFVHISEKIKASSNVRKCQICRYLKIMKQTHDHRANNLTFPNILHDF